MLGLRRNVAFVNGRIWTGAREVQSLRWGKTVLALGAPPSRGDVVVDLDGRHVLPGLINAHDHLELNHYGRHQPRAHYANVSEWIDDMRVALDRDPVLRDGRRVPLADRLFAGGLKNLLSGVTTVAHHNPLYPAIGRHVPVRVITRCRWAHSFALEGRPVGARGELGPPVIETLTRTPADLPCVVHMAEGTDEAAADELARLDRAHAVRDNSVFVHGVAIDAAWWQRAAPLGASLVWCPASNVALFGRTAPVRALLDLHGATTAPRPSKICLGTDSRLTGSAHLLDEVRAAFSTGFASPDEILRMVTTSAAAVLRLPSAGRLIEGGPSDLLVLPARATSAGEALLASERRTIDAVVVGGRPLLTSHALSMLFHARRESASEATIDEVPRWLQAGIARRVQSAPVREPGVVCH